MIISIDYDCTYTRDKILWDSFIQQAKARGHTVYCVTARNPKYDSPEVINDLKHLVDHIFFTAGTPKEAFMLRQGICVQVWIDDDVRAILPVHRVNEWGEDYNDYTEV